MRSGRAMSTRAVVELHDSGRSQCVLMPGFWRNSYPAADSAPADAGYATADAECDPGSSDGNGRGRGDRDGERSHAYTYADPRPGAYVRIQ